MTEKQHVNKQGDYYREGSTKQKHHDEVGSFRTVPGFFQHTTVSISEQNIKKKAEIKRSEEAKRCNQPP